MRHLVDRRTVLLSTALVIGLGRQVGVVSRSFVQNAYFENANLRVIVRLPGYLRTSDRMNSPKLLSTAVWRSAGIVSFGVTTALLSLSV